MSSQLDGHMQLPSSYNFDRNTVGHYRNKSIDPQNFQVWFQRDMYQSTYAKNHSPDSIEPRSAHIPGYAGFIPKDRAQSLYAKTFTNKTKDVFHDPSIHNGRSGLATTGFNITKDALVDKSKAATSHKYGKTELQTPHPGWVPQSWTTTTKTTYVDPSTNVDPTFRPTEKQLQTMKLKTKTSGFQQNRAYWDGQGWKPNKILNPLNVSSQYRDRFNPEMEYHRNTNKTIAPQLKHAEYKYSFNK